MQPSARAIILGGSLAASLDLAYAVLRNYGYGKPPIWTLQLVASGWFGEASFAGGMKTATIGLLSHYGIVLVAAGVFAALSRGSRATWAALLWRGLLFGMAVYVAMNFVVLPISNFPFEPRFSVLRLLEGLASHALLVGLPIACAARLAGTSR